LAAVGLFYDDATPQAPVSQQLLNVLTFNAGPTKNDADMKGTFPYMANPWRGFDYPEKPRF
jgi:hypothetical protein